MQQTKQNRFPFVAVPTAWLQRLTPQEGWVAIAIASHADKHGAAWPSVNALAAETGLCRRTIQRALRRLVDKGVITVAFRQRENGSNTSNQYTIDLTCGYMPPDEGGRLKDAGGAAQRREGGGTETPLGAAQRREGGGTETPLELDPDQLDPVELDPGKGEGTPAPDAPVVWDRNGMQYRSLPWEDTEHRQDPGFVQWLTDLWSKDKPIEKAREMANSSIRKSRRDEVSYLATRDRWERYQQYLQEQAQAAEDDELQRRVMDRIRRTGY